MDISTKMRFRLLAMLLCAAMLLSVLPGGVLAVDTAAVSDVNFDNSALDALQYSHGTVSAWLEYDCGNGIMTSGTNKSYLQVAVSTDYAHFEDYCIKMSQNENYTNVYQDNQYGLVGGSSDPVTYARYKAVDGSHIVYVYILNALNEVRVIVDTNADMTGVYADGFVYESTTGETAQPMMVMYGLSMAENGYHIDTASTHYCTNKVNSGALLVIRMPDNSLFINDGGSVEQWNDEACDRFMAFLREMTGKSEGEKVVINTWFLSHAHSDHFQGFTRFVDHYYDQIDLQSVMYNIDSERLDTARDITFLLKLFRSYFPAVKYYKPHTGEHFNIAGIEFDVVYTQEDRFYPTTNGQELLIDHLDGKSEYANHGSMNGTYREECFFETVYSYDSDNDTLVSTPTTYDYSDFNDTSTVIKVTFPSDITGADKDITSILYGDANRVDQTMLKVYDGTEMLKNDIMLVPHHGHDAHPELCQVSEADVFLYTQRKSAIYGPNGIVDYGVDVGGTYRPALVYNYMAMQEHLETGRTYWQGTETVCLTFGSEAQNLPTGMTRDGELSESTGIYGYTCDTISFEYGGWTVVSDVAGSGESSATGVEITTSRIRFDQVTSLKNQGQYMIVHNQTDNVLMYNAIARVSGQTKPNMAVSMEVGSGLAASNGLVDAYYKVTDTSQPDVETKTSIYCTRDKRDLSLWILGQDGVTGSGTDLKSATAKFGGTTAYSATTLYKGTASDNAYWYSVSGNDYVDSSKGNQWRYLRISGSPLFHNAETVTNWIEFFEDGTCVIYYYDSSSSIRFLSVTPEGNWVRSKKLKQSQITGDLLESLKLRMYEYKTRTGTKTIAYSGPQSFDILKDTGESDIINNIAESFRVMDSTARNRPIPCSGTTAKVGYYWMDGTIKASSVGSNEVVLKYRDDDGTDATICTINLNVLKRLYLDTVISSSNLTVEKGQTLTDGKICEVYHSADGYVTNDTAIVLGMLQNADGEAVSSDSVGVIEGLTLTYNGQVLGSDITLTVAGEEHHYIAEVTLPTCTENGFTTYTCTHCGDSYVADEVEALGHGFVDGSCTACGQACVHSWSGGLCTVCGKEYPEKEYYLFGYINGADYACQDDYLNLGEYKFENGTLTAVFKTNSYVAVKSGDNQDWYMTREYVDEGVTVATLYSTQTGAIEKMFVPGGKIITFTLEHNGDDTFTLRYTAVDCAHENHSIDGVCEICGAEVGHNYQTEVTAPGCTTEGYTTYSCSCGSSYVSDYVSATGHSDVVIPGKAATCTEDGLSDGVKCSVCGLVSQAQEVIPATGHTDEIIPGKAATCTEDGLSDGVKCSVCGLVAQAQEVISATGHTDEIIPGKAVTCTEDGLSDGVQCAVCGTVSEPQAVIPATGHNYMDGFCTGCGEEDPDAVTIPTLNLDHPSLSFEGEIMYNLYFTADDLTSVVEMGLIAFSTKNTEGTIENAENVYPGYIEAGGMYMGQTTGVPARYLGDAVYFKAYAKLSDGSYVYSGMVGYNAVVYAKSILKNSSNDYMKRLVVAMINYGAEAQGYFCGKEGVEFTPMNSFLTEEQQAMISAYDASMVADLIAVDSNKATLFTYNTGDFAKRTNSVSFDGAFAINYYFTAKGTPDNGMKFYYWNTADYLAADVLAPENATGSMDMVAVSGNQYWGQVSGIVAKEVDQTYFVAGVYELDGVTYTTGILAYSLGKYCAKLAAGTTEQQALSAATAVYGYYAKEYFANI